MSSSGDDTDRIDYSDEYDSEDCDSCSSDDVDNTSLSRSRYMRFNGCRFQKYGTYFVPASEYRQVTPPYKITDSPDSDYEDEDGDIDSSTFQYVKPIIVGGTPSVEIGDVTFDQDTEEEPPAKKRKCTKEEEEFLEDFSEKIE